MAGFEETFKGLLLEFLKRRGIHATAVTNYEESASSYQYGCETCGDFDTDFEVEIFYDDDSGRSRWNRTYTYDGKFADLIIELSAIDKEMNGEAE